MKIASGLFLGATIALAIACGAAKKSNAPQSSGGVAPLGVGGAASPQGNEIEKLAGEIKADLDKLAIPVPTAGLGDPIPTAENLVPPSSDATCKPAQTDTCKDTCTLADAICKNSKLICDIAADMNNDAWADGKCNDGKRSCDAARTKCCGCA